MESATERNTCYECHNKIHVSQQKTDNICLDCHGKMIQQMKRDFETNGACCDYNGT